MSGLSRSGLTLAALTLKGHIVRSELHWHNTLASVLATLKPYRAWTGLPIPHIQKGKCMVSFSNELWLFLALLKAPLAHVGDGQAAYLHSKSRAGKGSKI